MLQDAHSRKISEAVSAPAGDTIIIPRSTNLDEWHYIHELIGDLSGAGSLIVVAIDDTSPTPVERILGEFNLAEGQGLTLQDEPGEDNRPRFEFRPDEDAVLRTVGADFTGALHWSIRR